jgi:hypothetical protein
MILFTAPGSRQLVYLHRLVAWHFGVLGDLSRLDVHHRNGNPADNRPENLEIFSHAEHSHQRALTARRVQACVVCGRIFFRAVNPRPHSPGHHCSNGCALVTARQARSCRRATARAARGRTHKTNT